jgi:hypothetical protein
MHDASATKPRRVLRQLGVRYIQVTETGARGFAALGGSMALVWFEILYRVWKARKPTVSLPNGRLAEMGVSRVAKYRALHRLEQAGWIQVERPRHKSPQVTLLVPGCLKE